MNEQYEKHIYTMNEHWNNGLLHCKNGPAIMTERLGQKYHEHWHYGELHRVDGPAVWHDRVREEWFENNRRHREDGPALEIHGRIRLPLRDENFNILPRLDDQPQPWRNFPRVGDQWISRYLNDVFGSEHPFASFGDFGAEPGRMVEKLKLEARDVNYRISYENRRWRDLFYVSLTDQSGQPTHPKAKDDGHSPGVEAAGEDSPGIFDRLGEYDPARKLITLYVPAIAECAAALDNLQSNPCGPAGMTLTTLVFLHELGHALHHTARGAELNDKLGGLPVAETVAQHFMMTCTRAHGVRAEWLANRLELGQPAEYRAWRDCGFETSWDGCQRLICSLKN